MNAEVIFSALEPMLKPAGADHVHICAQLKQRKVLRFYDRRIHANLDQQTVAITIEVRRGRQRGIVTVQSLERRVLDAALQQACALARRTPKEQLPPIPEPFRIAHAVQHCPATADFPAERMSALIQDWMQTCAEKKATLAGSCTTGSYQYAVLNSSGAHCYATHTLASLRPQVLHQAQSGFANGVSWSIDHLNPELLLQEALDQLFPERDFIDLPLGDYSVILGPEAVAELLQWLAFTAFNAKSFEDQSSFLYDQLTQQVAHPSLSISDDTYDADTLQLPFDFEGSPRQQVPIISEGQAVGFVTDARSAERLNLGLTGHASLPGSGTAPEPLHLSVAAGKQTMDELFAACRKGLFLPRFHYVNGFLNPRKALMTGLTRDGAALVEGGKPVAPIKRMRFTQSLAESFRSIRGISKERRLVADPNFGLSAYCVPAIAFDNFAFTGKAE